MQMRVITKQGFILRRVHCKLGEIITWEVLSNDEKVRIAVIRQLNDPWGIKRYGWHKFQIKYWLGTIFWDMKHIIGHTRESLLEQILNRNKQSDDRMNRK